MAPCLLPLVLRWPRSVVASSFLLRRCWLMCGVRSSGHAVVRLLVLRGCVWLHVWVRPRRLLLLLLLLRLLLLWFG